MKTFKQCIQGSKFLNDFIKRSRKPKTEELETDKITKQKQLCEKYGAEFLPADDWEKLGIAHNAKQEIIPVNGLRMYPEDGTCGWFIWTGEEPSEDPEFFEALHTIHIEERLEDITKYLGLAPGWRFLVAGDYVDVWFDDSLLDEEHYS